MIRRASSDLPTFKRLTFDRGLNILLADKSEGATDRQSRNGAGKTSFVELIHFLFGANATKDSIFRSEALEPYIFDATTDLKDQTIIVARSGSKPSRIRIQGDTSRWPQQGVLDEKTGDIVLTNEDWKAVLGALMFGLPIDSEDDKAIRFGPSFRSLFSYFARRQLSSGFLQPIQHSAQQQPWDQQVAVSYLLGLDWTVPQRFQKIRNQERATAELRKAVREGGLGRFFGTAADLRTRATIAEARVRRLKEQIASFRVVPEYAELEREASELTRTISDLSNNNTTDRELILQLQNSLKSEQPPAIGNVDRLYREAGVVLPEIALKRFEEVEQFHRTIVENRRSHLSKEVEATRGRIAQRERQMNKLDERRAQIMDILRSGGALEHYARLQEEVGRAESEAASLRERLTTAERMESTKAELDIERARLFKSLQDDHHERREIIKEAILLFEDLSNALYERAGSLTITAGPNGPVFEVRIDASRSKGITNMQIFCFDLMLAELTTRRGRGPGFLIHDSHLFDGVDERQVAKALQLGAERSEAVGFQYIVTLNSDALPQDGFRPGFSVDDYLLDTKLTDATETGGLFGIRFN